LVPTTQNSPKIELEIPKTQSFTLNNPERLKLEIKQRMIWLSAVFLLSYLLK